MSSDSKMYFLELAGLGSTNFERCLWVSGELCEGVVCLVCGSRSKSRTANRGPGHTHKMQNMIVPGKQDICLRSI